MAIKTGSMQIDDETWEVTQFPGGRGAKYLIKLTKLIGPTLIRVFDSAKGKNGTVNVEDLVNANVDGEVLAAAVDALVDKLDETEALDFIKKLLELTRCEGQEVVPSFDIIFQGRYGVLFKVLGFVLKVNYTRFLAESAQSE